MQPSHQNSLSSSKIFRGYSTGQHNIVFDKVFTRRRGNSTQHTHTQKTSFLRKLVYKLYMFIFLPVNKIFWNQHYYQIDKCYAFWVTLYARNVCFLCFINVLCSIKIIRQITTYSLVVWLKFKLFTWDLKFDTLST